ncbi:transmembrane channel-like protein 5 [Styela clava]
MEVNDERELDQSFSQLIAEQENEIGFINYGATIESAGNGAFETYENPAHDSAATKSNSIEEIELNVISRNGASNAQHEGTSLVRRRVKSVKESSVGIEHILDNMPSRTVGRKHGAKVAANVSTLGKFGSLYRHNRLASMSPDDVDATDELYNEIATTDGDIDNSELRELPVNMTLKKKVRSKAKEKVEDAEAMTFSWYSLWKFKMALKWRHFKDDVHKFLSSGKLWSYHLKQVEGYFGTGVLSYFTFLRGIFLLSLPSFLLSFLFISVPQLLDRPTKPQCQFTGEGFLTGANCLTNTIMYQGYYVNGTINKVGNTTYNMPLAYLFATFGYFIFCLIWLVRVTGILFRENYIDAKEDSSNFVNKIFCSWDFGTTSQSTADICHKTITTDLKEVLSEQRRGSDHSTKCQKFEVFLMRSVSWIFYLAIVAGAVALIYFVNKIFICEIKSHTENNPIFQDLALPLIVSTINLILPYIITLITHLERYKYRRHELYMNVLRNFLFKMSILAVVCAFWTSNNVQSCAKQSNETSICWETELGQEIYRLVIVDFIFSMIFSTFCAEFLVKHLSKLIGRKGPEFSIANNVMDLIYGQTLCWIGVYFSPLLAFINMIKYFLLFYVKKISVMRNCRPSTKRWRAAQSQTLFNMVQLISFILSTAFLAYVIFNEIPSKSCGPFRGQSRAYDIVVTLLDNLAQSNGWQWLATLLRIITNVWVLDAIVIVILILVIFARNKAHGLSNLAGTLEEQISLEGKDKSLLFKWLQKLSKKSGFSDAPGPSSKPPGDVLMASAVYNNDDLDVINDSAFKESLPPTTSL